MEVPYHLNYTTAVYHFGNKYEYTVDVPTVGLAITRSCNGYGSGHSQSYIVTKIFHNKRGEVNKFKMNRIISFTPETAIIDSDAYLIVTQSHNRSGTWVLKGDKSHHMIYYLRFGYIAPYDPGFMK